MPRRHKPDYWLFVLCMTLLAIGLVVVYAISPALGIVNGVNQNYYAYKQVIAVLLGIAAFFIVAQIPLNKWRLLHKPLLIIAIAATLIALVLPVNAQYPAHRWIRLGGFSFQSVELLKFAILIWLAVYLSNCIIKGTITARKTLIFLTIVVLAIGLVVAGKQSDLGSMGVLVVMIGMMAFVAGLPLKRALMIVAIVIIGTILAISSSSYRRERLTTYFHPTQNCQGSGLQACQALIAVGSGGAIGLGLGRSVEAYGYLPESGNDSIFAIYAEKFGFIGSIVLLGLFAALFSRLKNIIERTPDDFSRLLVVGVLAWLSVQTLINIGAMIGLLPLKGITLPFISYGGTSVVFIMAAMGLVFQVSRYTSYIVPITNKSEGKYQDENHTDRRRIRGTYNSVVGSRP
ncbi:MAG TPA: putative peptidoglycan glycosyltransferase FtsW [Candidatus Saccharimonadales bacterium]|nr:putative peptidoglycan glycosyltransferase FtsW [Candidatus Saccharimonadales bacterium]